MDLNDSLGRAVRAARRGDLDALDLELGRLKALPSESVVGIDNRLRAMALSVRCHPSYRTQSNAQAG